MKGDVRCVGDTAVSLLDALSDQRLSRAYAQGREHNLTFARMGGEWVLPQGVRPRSGIGRGASRKSGSYLSRSQVPERRRFAVVVPRAAGVG